MLRRVITAVLAAATLASTAEASATIYLFKASTSKTTGNLGTRATTNAMCANSLSRPQVECAATFAVLVYGGSDSWCLYDGTSTQSSPPVPGYTPISFPTAAPIKNTAGSTIATSWASAFTTGLSQTLFAAGIFGASDSFFTGADSAVQSGKYGCARSCYGSNCQCNAGSGGWLYGSSGNPPYAGYGYGTSTTTTWYNSGDNHCGVVQYLLCACVANVAPPPGTTVYLKATPSTYPSPSVSTRTAADALCTPTLFPTLNCATKFAWYVRDDSGWGPQAGTAPDGTTFMPMSSTLKGPTGTTISPTITNAYSGGTTALTNTLDGAGATASPTSAWTFWFGGLGQYGWPSPGGCGSSCNCYSWTYSAAPPCGGYGLTNTLSDRWTQSGCAGCDSTDKHILCACVVQPPTLSPTRSPSRSPTTSKPSISPTTSTPSRSPSRSPTQVCYVGASWWHLGLRAYYGTTSIDYNSPSPLPTTDSPGTTGVVRTATSAGDTFAMSATGVYMVSSTVQFANTPTPTPSFKYAYAGLIKGAGSTLYRNTYDPNMYNGIATMRAVFAYAPSPTPAPGPTTAPYNTITFKGTEYYGSPTASLSNNAEIPAVTISYMPSYTSWSATSNSGGIVMASGCDVVRWTSTSPTVAPILATLSQSTTNGDALTITSAGMYAINVQFSDTSSGNVIVITKNMAAGATFIEYTPFVNTLMFASQGDGWWEQNVAWVGALRANDVVRVHVTGFLNRGANSYVTIDVHRIGCSSFDNTEVVADMTTYENTDTPLVNWTPTSVVENNAGITRDPTGLYFNVAASGVYAIQFEWFYSDLVALGGILRSPNGVTISQSNMYCPDNAAFPTTIYFLAGSPRGTLGSGYRTSMVQYVGPLSANDNLYFFTCAAATSTPSPAPSPMDYTGYRFFKFSATDATFSPSKSPSKAPSKSPSRSPSRAPSVSPTTSKPSKSPSRAPSKSPSRAPSKAPSKSPSKSPTTSNPSKSPSRAPSKAPSASPTTSKPSKSPSRAPSKAPSASPATSKPSKSPSRAPSKAPSTSPSRAPSRAPSKSPTTSKPSRSPSRAPSKAPSKSPTTSNPSKSPSKSPSHSPSISPTTSKPSKSPSRAPSHSPSKSPTTSNPSKSPSRAPSASPSVSPTTSKPSKTPSRSPSKAPSQSPTTSNPSKSPSKAPSLSPSRAPTSSIPTKSPSRSPSTSPSKTPTTSKPSKSPSETPTTFTAAPSGSPTTSHPSKSPSAAPSNSPTTSNPSRSPSHAPSGSPSQTPSVAPSHTPSRAPSGSPSQTPSQAPTFPPTRRDLASNESGVVVVAVVLSIVFAFLGLAGMIFVGRENWRACGRRVESAIAAALAPPPTAPTHANKKKRREKQRDS